MSQYQDQGISVADLHREYLETQQQVDGLQQFYALIADPSTRQQALAQFDQEYAQLQGAPSMPGGSGATDAVGMFNEAVSRGTGTPHGRSLMGQVPAHITAQALMNSLPDL